MNLRVKCSNCGKNYGAHFGEDCESDGSGLGFQPVFKQSPQSKRKKLYTFADLEAVAAVTGEFFFDNKKYNKFYDSNVVDSGFVGVWAYCRDAALVLEQEAKAFGTPGDDYDWVLVVQDFAAGLYQYKTSSELVTWAREVFTKHQYILGDKQ
jgi:hypothetical protein